MPGPLHGVRIIVAGAGLAGLTAAYETSRAGASVHMVEASERVGGRVWTFRDPPIAPFHAELGGEFIESDHRAIRGLCKTFDLPLKRVLLRGFGLAAAIGRGIRVYRKQTPLWKAFAELFSAHVDAIEAARGDWTSTAAAAVARRSLQNVLDEAGAGASVRALATALRNLYVGDPPDLSALMAAEEVRAGGDPTAVVMYRIAGGNDRLVQALVNAQPSRLELGCRILAVTQTERRVRATVDGRRGRTVVEADAMVLALPIPWLRKVRFEPRPPAAQQLAFDTLSVGPATKALLRFAAPWWRTPGLPRAFGTNLPIGAVWDTAEEQRDAAMLTLLAGGRASASLARLAKAGPRRVARELAWLNGGAPEVPAMHTISWEDEPWARGAYEYFSPAFDPALQPLLGRGFGRVFFAGAHTSREFAGYMNGAVASGQRVAREIAALAPIMQSAR